MSGMRTNLIRMCAAGVASAAAVGAAVSVPVTAGATTILKHVGTHAGSATLTKHVGTHARATPRP